MLERMCFLVIWIPKPCVDKTITINIIIYQSTEWQTEDTIPHIGPHEKSQIKPYLHVSLQRCSETLFEERDMLCLWYGLYKAEHKNISCGPVNNLHNC